MVLYRVGRAGERHRRGWERGQGGRGERGGFIVRISVS